MPRGSNYVTAEYAGNASVFGSTNDLVGGQIVTNHPPTAVADSFSRASGTSLKITIANLLTNDTDFLRIHSEWLGKGRAHAGIVYWPQRMPVGDAIRRLLADSLGASPAEVASTVRYL